MERERSEIEAQMKEYAFQLWSVTNGNKLQAIDSEGINLILTHDEAETFELAYMVPKSIAKVTIGPCSPFHNKEHFMKQLRLMRIIVGSLKHRRFE